MADIGIRMGAPVLAKDLRLKFKPDAKVEDVVQAAMDAVNEPNGVAFMCTSDDETFRCAVAGLLVFYKDNRDVIHRIEHEIKMLKFLSAAMTGVAVDFEALGELNDEAPEPLGLLGVYRATKEKKHGQ